jgi:hypothetical protein
MMALGLQPFKLRTEVCPFNCCKQGVSTTVAQGAFCLHALICRTQDQYWGKHQTHTTVKRVLQYLLRVFNVNGVLNEQEAIFTRAGLRADTTVQPGALLLACDAGYREGKGACIDNRVCSPVAEEYIHASGGSAWATDGYAAQEGERLKDRHYAGGLEERRWVLVPFVQECFGRLGVRALTFLREVAWHSASCRGGDRQAIVARRAVALQQMMGALSVTMARCSAERVLAYVRAAAQKGVRASATSSALA